MDKVFIQGRQYGKSWAAKVTAALDMKTLFVPLKTIYYEAFKAGKKRNEYRIYGPRWNERTCVVGRRATLSKGYGRSERLSGFIVSYRKVSARELSKDVQADILACFGTLDKDIAEIGFGGLK